MERAVASAHDFALVERSLFVVCEFWAPIGDRERMRVSMP